MFRCLCNDWLGENHCRLAACSTDPGHVDIVKSLHSNSGESDEVGVDNGGREKKQENVLLVRVSLNKGPFKTSEQHNLLLVHPPDPMVQTPT